MSLHSSRAGAMMIMTVMIAGTVALTIGLSMAMRGIGELDMGFSTHQSLETLAIADGCVEEGLLQLTRNSSYSGGTLAIGEGECSIVVTNAGAQSTMVIVAALDRWARTLTVRIDTSTSPFTILQWEQGVE